MPSGVMVNWHNDKGFGFIRPNQGGEDVFCHVSDLLHGEGSVQEGDEVRYIEKYDERKGKTRAAEVEVSAGGHGGGSRRDSSRRRRSRSHHRGGYSRHGDDRDGSADGQDRDSSRGRGGGRRRERGVMLRWQADKGFGFIQPDDGGDDVFCHVTGLVDGEGSARDGDTVTFLREFNDRRGKDQAVSVRMASGGRSRREYDRGGRGCDRRGSGREYERAGGRDYERGRDNDRCRDERGRGRDDGHRYDDDHRRRDRDYHRR